MRGDTEVIVGIRSVGDKSAQPIIESMNTLEATKRIAQYIAMTSLAQRFQFVIGRTKADVLVGLGLSATNREAQLREKAERVSDFIDGLFDAPAGGQTDES